MLAEIVIEWATARWAAPMVFGRDINSLLRFCVEYGRLNAVTAPNSYPYPSMAACRDGFG